MATRVIVPEIVAAKLRRRAPLDAVALVGRQMVGALFAGRPHDVLYWAEVASFLQTEEFCDVLKDQVKGARDHFRTSLRA